MIDLLAAAAGTEPERSAVVTTEGSTSYADLLEQSRRVAAGLRRRGITRLAIAEADAAWVLRLLAGAALAGAEPCQYQPDTEAGELVGQIRALGHEVVVTRRKDLAGASTVLRPEELLDAPARDGVPTGEPQPLMIRTTGTTGTPKAARHDWQVLTRTVASVRPRPEQRWLLAYGPHQFAGIQVLLHVAASRATLVAPFPRQPRDGLDALLRDGVTCVSATPTFWRFLLAEARGRKVPLPELEQVTLGGEASPADLLADLGAAFPSANVSQVYASTEFGSVLSVRDGRPGLALDALFSASNPSSDVRVVDGELWVRAGTGMLGYAGEPGQPGQPGQPDDAAERAGEGWKPTGDLVEIVGDRVLFRGRSTDVINVGGVKVAPLPVEERILSLDCVGAARVYGRPSPLTGAIVAVDVVPDAPGELDAARVRDAIREAVADLPRAWQPRTIKFVEAIETRGGKTVRGTRS